MDTLHSMVNVSHRVMIASHNLIVNSFPVDYNEDKYDVCYRDMAFEKQIDFCTLMRPY